MYVEEALKSACQKLMVNDVFLLTNNAHEQAVSHRLAVYLEPHFPSFHVDCEYNKMEDLPKVLLEEPKYEEHNLVPEGMRKVLKDRWAEGSIFVGRRPDVIVHRRGLSKPEHNLLVVECKIEEPRLKGEIEEYFWSILKVNEFTAERQLFKYQYGAFIVFKAKGSPSGYFFTRGSQPKKWTA